MKHGAIIFFQITLLFAFSNCRTRDCHKAITITNKSQDTVLYALVLTHGEDGCRLTEEARLAPGDHHVQNLRTCWEDELEFRNFEMYIVDPNSFYTGDFYACDSIPIKNTILKHFVLTKDDLPTLKTSEFTLTYP